VKSFVKAESTEGFMKTKPAFAENAPLSSLPGAAAHLNVPFWSCPHCSSTTPSVGPPENTASPAVQPEAGSVGSIGEGVGVVPGVPVVEHLVMLNLPEWSAGTELDPDRMSYISGLTLAEPMMLAIGSDELFGVAKLPGRL